jgi:DNA-binding CsgD family transcriptional regulator
MKDKSTVNQSISQHLVAGICQSDNSIEFFGIKKTKQVKYMQNGKTHDFNELTGKPALALAYAFSRNEEAKDFFKSYKEDLKQIKHARKVELFVYYMYGDLDHKPDFVNGELQTTENFRDTTDCPSLGFKSLKIDGQKLTSREITIIDCFHADYTNGHTASILGITESTFDYHSRNLFKKAGVQTKTALMIKCALQHVISW